MPDFKKFREDFYSEARLFASARPLTSQSVDEFENRMRGIAGKGLRSFEEKVLGCDVSVFGNIAVAEVACENTENGTDVNRNVETMLLAKDSGHWKILAQAWDKETAENQIPHQLL